VLYLTLDYILVRIRVLLKWSCFCESGTGVIDSLQISCSYSCWWHYSCSCSCTEEETWRHFCKCTLHLSEVTWASCNSYFVQC